MESFWGPFWGPFWDLFQDKFANLPFLLKTHGACTRALILRFWGPKIHHFLLQFSAPFLVPFWIPKMGPKWVQNGTPQNRKIAFEGFVVPPLAPKVPKKGVPKMVPKMDPQKIAFLSPEGPPDPYFGPPRRNARWPRGGKEGLKPFRVPCKDSKPAIQRSKIGAWNSGTLLKPNNT